MKSVKTVCIHIVTYNSVNFIESCIEAALSQTYPISEILVIDNCSTDGTMEIVGKYDGLLKIIRNSENFGFAKAHNQAIRLTNSDYFLVLNPDVKLDKDYVRILVEKVTSNESIGAATGMLFRTNNVIDTTGLIIRKSKTAYDRGANQSVFNIQNLTEEIFGVSGAAALYSRLMAQNISINEEFFDSSFFAYKEDIDLAWRAKLFGWNSIYISNAIADHVRGWKQGERKKQPLFIRKHSYINRYKMMIKNETITSFIVCLPQIIIYEILSLGFILLREPKLLQAWLDLIKELKGLLQTRKFIQKKRVLKNKDIIKWFL